MSHAIFQMSVTERGQVTIPKYIRKMFQIKPKGKVIFEVSDGEARMIPSSPSLEELFQNSGKFNAQKPFSKKEARKVREDDLVEKWA